MCFDFEKSKHIICNSFIQYGISKHLDKMFRYPCKRVLMPYNTWHYIDRFITGGGQSVRLGIQIKVLCRFQFQSFTVVKGQMTTHCIEIYRDLPSCCCRRTIWLHFTVVLKVCQNYGNVWKRVYHRVVITIAITSIKNMEWKYLSFPKLQRLRRWSLGMDK